MEEVKLKYRENIATQIRRLFKTEFHCDGNNEDGLEVVTKEVPCSATELAKWQEQYSQLPRESETKYVWRPSLTRGDRIKLNKDEAQGYSGSGVFLPVEDKGTPWSQWAAYWAGALDPLERGSSSHPHFGIRPTNWNGAESGLPSVNAWQASGTPPALPDVIEGWRRWNDSFNKGPSWLSEVLCSTHSGSPEGSISFGSNDPGPFANVFGHVGRTGGAQPSGICSHLGGKCSRTNRL